ncbi:leucine-rich repeat domain-containing protein [Cryomorphaceae bacterium]|nr:leucine-rich repeat domain-containing protein [Cryomorphaceae bacterium]
MRGLVVVIFCVATLGLQGQNWVSGKKAERWSEVEYLDLSKMKMGKTGIPDSLWQMTQLKGLNLSRNKLNALSGQICNLTSLEQLILNRNDIYVLPEEIGCLQKLTYLDLWSNHIDNLPKSMETIPNLKKVDFSGIVVFPERQDELTKRFPNTELKFNKSCNCH